jgi:hypothetical protein
MMILKEAVVAEFKGTFPAFDWRDWGKTQKGSVTTAGLRAEIWTQDLPNTKDCQLLDHNFRSVL